MTLIAEPNRGLISSLRWRRGESWIDLLYSPASRPSDQTGISRFGCWPLVPFANRCEGGRLRCGDLVHQLPLNEPLENRAMHGCGWQRAWQVVRLTDIGLTLALQVDDFGPYRFDAAFDLELTDFGARFSLSVRNVGENALPFGIGLHPWFYCEPDTEFMFVAERRATFAAAFKPAGETTIEKASDFRSSRVISRDTELVVNFIDGARSATILYPGSHTISLEFDPVFRAPLLWRPRDANFFCFEPQSHSIGAPGDAHARAAVPLQILSPGASLAGSMTISAATIL